MDLRVLQSYRLAIGLAQGLFLFGLQQAFANQIWPATNAHLFASLLMAGFFVPLIAISGLGNLRQRTLAIWLAVATLICVGLASYSIYRMPIFGVAPPTRVWPLVSSQFVVCLAALLFIADNLVVAGDADRRWIARYPTLFDASWKHGVQAALALLFVSVLWGILFLGAQLFALIKIVWVGRVIAQPLFWIPVTAVGVAYALHVADSRARIVNGARTLVLVLLSWLLPVMTLLAAGFILTIPFTGLDVLWNTKRATAILLTAAGVLVFLINAAYQDGEDETARLLRYCRAAAAIVLLPIVALASYALMLRVNQYGWTPDRVIAAALAVVAACYALGYAAAIARTGLSLRWLEPVNVGTAFVIILLFLTLLTPLADPARISVNSQLARLEAGIVTPEKFDYNFLRVKTGRYGADALDAMAKQAYGPVAADNAERVRRSPFAAARPSWPPPPPAEKRLANITMVLPKGAEFPASLIQQDWSNDPKRFSLPRCLIADAKCEAALVDIDGDGTDEVLLVTVTGGSAVALKRRDDRWQIEGTLSNAFCHGFRDGFGKGEITLAEPKYKDIQVGSQRVVIQESCPPRPPAGPTIQGRVR
ncbi:DUF4153 domain-containing protein [Undibacter mobilis]|nr:DUF4153 domain-containing protein [Undibacter mobilis]